MRAVASVVGKISVFVEAPVDLDDPDLVISLKRDGQVITTWNVHSLPWRQPVLSYVDTPGDTAVHSYTAVAASAVATSPSSASSSVAAATTSASYPTAVRASNASLYWRLDDTVAPIAADYSTGAAAPGEYYLPTFGVAGATSDGDTAAGFTGVQDQYGQGPVVYSAGQFGPGGTPIGSAYSLEAWFSTTSTTGGEIIGFGDKPTALSANHDKQLYLDNGGHVVFTVKTASSSNISLRYAGQAYNDGQFHHVVATVSSTGMALYVDGVQVVSNSNNSAKRSYTGYWRVGGDNLAGMGNAPSDNYFTGTIDEVAVYPTALTASQVAAHFAAR